MGFEFDDLHLTLTPVVNYPLMVNFVSNMVKIPIYNANGSLEGYNTSYKLPVYFTMNKCLIGEELIAS